MQKRKMWIGICIFAILGIVVFGIIKFVLMKPIPHELTKVTYLPIYKSWSINSVKGDLLTTANLAFATITADSTIELRPIPELDLTTSLTALKEKYPHLKINLSIGGWGANGFSDMALSKETRSVFINSVVEHLEQYNLDGVDIDWEFPTRDESGLTKTRPEDTENFILLMKELRSKFDVLKKTNDKKYSLSFATPIGDWAIKAFGVKQVSKSVDYIYLMGYDYIGNWSNVTGHHSNFKNDKSTTHLSTYDGIKRFMKVCPPEKLVVGIPAYGYGWSGVGPTDSGLFQNAKGIVPTDDLIYSNLKDKYISKNGFTRYWDNSSKAAYLYNGDIWITYEDLEAIQYKAETVKSLGLGGMMYWEHTQDLTGDVITTISNSLAE